MNKNAMILDALNRMAMSLDREHWQAIVAVKGVPYPYSQIEKIRVLENLIIRDKREVSFQMR